MSTEGGTKAVIAAAIANVGIAVTKFVAYLITGSSSMLSEAIHSLADTGNQFLLLIGGKRSLEAPDAEHQFGYGRRRYVYAFVVAIILFMLGGMFSLYEGWHKISHPEELTKVWVAYAVLFIAIALESWSFRTAFREANKSRGSRTPQAVHPGHQAARAAGRPARGPRRPARPRAGALRHHHGRRHRGRTMGRCRLPGDRHAVVVHRRVPGLRGVRAAGRGVGVARAGDRHPGCTHRPVGRRLDHPHAHAAHRPGRAARRREGRRAVATCPPASSPSSSTRRSSVSATRCRRPSGSTSSPTSSVPRPSPWCPPQRRMRSVRPIPARRSRPARTRSGSLLVACRQRCDNRCSDGHAVGCEPSKPRGRSPAGRPRAAPTPAHHAAPQRGAP